MKHPTTSTSVQSLEWTNRVLTVGTWLLIAGVVFYSLMTTTPFVASHSRWSWSGPALGIMTDIAFVMALQAESVLARHGVKDLGMWPRVFRWFTGGATVFLNIWDSVAKRDVVGVAVHLIAPALLMLVAEVAPVYRAAMSRLIEQHPDRQVNCADGLVDTGAVHQPSTPVPSTSTPTASAEPPTAPALARPLAICGEQQVFTLSVPLAATRDEEEAEEPVRLASDEALAVINACWVQGVSLSAAAARSTRSTSYVFKVYKRLEAETEAAAREPSKELVLAGS